MPIMPNWVNNRLKVKGEEERVVEFIRRVAGMPQVFEYDHKIHPMGDEQAPEVQVFSFHALVPIPEDILKTKPYDPDGINAEHELWGVKWGACDAKLVDRRVGEVNYHFDTAWSPPTVFLKTVSGMFPKLTFILDWLEEQGYNGTQVFRGGEMLEDIQGVPIKMYEDEDEEDDPPSAPGCSGAEFTMASVPPDESASTAGFNSQGYLEEELEKFVAAYVEAALWWTNDESDSSGGKPLDDTYGPSDVDENTWAAMEADCRRFIVANYQDLITCDSPKYTWMDLGGHDFWLSRNGHGAGFFDRDEWSEEVRNRLQEAAKAFGEVNLYVENDKIYQQ